MQHKLANDLLTHPVLLNLLGFSDDIIESMGGTRVEKGCKILEFPLNNPNQDIIRGFECHKKVVSEFDPLFLLIETQFLCGTH